MHDASGGASELPCMSCKAARVQHPGSLYESYMSEHRSSNRGPMGLRSFRLCSFLLLLAILVFAAACSSSAGGSGSATAREAALRQIAAEYARTGDLTQAQAALDRLNLANPGQLLLSLAEADVATGRAREEIEATAALAEMLGARSQKLTAYLSPTMAPVPTREAVPPTAAPTVVVATIEPASPIPPSPTSMATATLAPTAIEPPPTASSTPEPQEPRVIADGNVNLRSGPGRAYPVIGQLRGGQETPIIGRNASGDWWQIEFTGARQAWVAGTVVRVLGAIDTVAVAKNIPAPPTAAPRPTAAPQPTAPPAAPAGPHFTLVVRRLWTLEETGGHLAGGISVNCGYAHNLHVYVKDAAGNLLNGVTIREAGGVQQELASGSKAPGMAEFDLYPPGKDVYIIRDVDGRQATSDTGAAPTLTAPIPYDILRGSHYCTDDADCAHFVSEGGCNGHYTWDMEFRRNY